MTRPRVFPQLDGSEGRPRTSPLGEADPLLQQLNMLSALEAVLLFHSGGDWDEKKRSKWKSLTGKDEATTKVLCDLVRAALLMDPVP